MECTTQKHAREAARAVTHSARNPCSLKLHSGVPGLHVQLTAVVVLVTDLICREKVRGHPS